VRVPVPPSAVRRLPADRDPGNLAVLTAGQFFAGLSTGRPSLAQPMMPSRMTLTSA
jgi:hypothetical protein